MARKNFFRLSPDTDFHNDSIGAAIHLSYGSPKPVTEFWAFAEGEIITDIKSIILDALKEIFNGSSQILNAGLFNITFKSLLSGIHQGYGTVQYNTPDKVFLESLESSAEYFTARKTALQVSQLKALLLREDGSRRPWSEFKKLSNNIVGNYNKTWLKTEYDTTIAVARSARQWKDFEKTAHLYPNIEYMKTSSAMPRKDHEGYVGIIRPIDDPFWNDHTPPNGFGCKCDLQSVDKPHKPLPLDLDKTDPVQPVLQNNAGKTGQIFNVSKTAYFQNTQHISDEELKNEIKTIIT